MNNIDNILKDIAYNLNTYLDKRNDWEDEVTFIIKGSRGDMLLLSEVLKCSPLATLKQSFDDGRSSLIDILHLAESIKKVAITDTTSSDVVELVNELVGNSNN